jgi:Transposase domain (DUF772)
MVVCLLAYAYCVGERSSRGIERRCREDVAFRVICANQVPDHATVARFRALGSLVGSNPTPSVAGSHLVVLSPYSLSMVTQGSHTGIRAEL